MVAWLIPPPPPPPPPESAEDNKAFNDDDEAAGEAARGAAAAAGTGEAGAAFPPPPPPPPESCWAMPASDEMEDSGEDSVWASCTKDSGEEDGDDDDDDDDEAEEGAATAEFELEAAVLMPKRLPMKGSMILRETSPITEFSSMAIWKRSIRGAKYAISSRRTG